MFVVLFLWLMPSIKLDMIKIRHKSASDFYPRGYLLWASEDDSHKGVALLQIPQNCCVYKYDNILCVVFIKKDTCRTRSYESWDPAKSGVFADKMMTFTLRKTWSIK